MRVCVRFKRNRRVNNMYARKKKKRVVCTRIQKRNERHEIVRNSFIEIYSNTAAVWISCTIANITIVIIRSRFSLAGKTKQTAFSAGLEVVVQHGAFRNNRLARVKHIKKISTKQNETGERNNWGFCVPRDSPGRSIRTFRHDLVPTRVPVPRVWLSCARTRACCDSGHGGPRANPLTKTNTYLSARMCVCVCVCIRRTGVAAGGFPVSTTRKRN